MLLGQLITLLRQEAKGTVGRSLGQRPEQAVLHGNFEHSAEIVSTQWRDRPRHCAPDPMANCSSQDVFDFATWRRFYHLVSTLRSTAGPAPTGRPHRLHKLMQQTAQTCVRNAPDCLGA
jgi:hypothetical protein